jgi:hypothetical protein
MKAAAVPAVTWKGIHQADVAYLPGQLVTKSGGLWLATRETNATPGSNDSGWTLVCKAGNFSSVRGVASARSSAAPPASPTTPSPKRP